MKNHNNTENEAEFDFFETEYQENTFKTDSGQDVTIGVEYVDGDTYEQQNPNSRLTYKNVPNGTRKVYIYLGTVNMWYYIKIYNGKITSAYGADCQLVGCWLASEKLSRPSSTLAKYTVKINHVYPTTTTAILYSQLSGTTLKVYTN